ncbi:FAD-dependent oxidoreductase [Polyangium mundeleinium]|uniref:NAD(P)-binding protein n=1 Tax=Polyangium mundeleinium TaxID=2995306 RepID=A0ABT5ESQ4_9BACT|nr:FAD-dependent oxidoreductase [Polyangium mundeleinium]MDC0744382.1 NAD(P)-binding protein [Polyangium mundeleinium]
MHVPGRPIRVAIIGGGCASMAAAFELTRPEHRGLYDVTIYQMGFRLGGKGASGRGPSGRIEEHGLHLWMGFYENAFRLMRSCYGELGRNPRACPIATFEDAFAPAPVVGVTDRLPSGAWEPWVAHFPPGKGRPGDPLEERNPFSVAGYLEKALALVPELLRSANAGRAAPGWPASEGARRAGASPGDVLGMIERILRYGQLATTAAVFEAVDLLRTALQSLFALSPRDSVQATLLRLLDAIGAVVRRELDAIVGGDMGLRRVWEVVELILCIVRGSLRYGLAFHPDGFDAINEYEWSDWLRRNGASEHSLDSGFVRALYDLAFAYEEGDIRRPALAAGVALRGALRMFFTYRGSLFFRMQAGMGDIVFAPMYEVLKKRGAHFEFFHRLRNVKLSPPEAGPAHVTALEFDVQAEIVSGGEYAPLVDIKGLPCWPSKADPRQLVDGERLEREGWAFESHWETRRAGEKTVRVGDDFDFVVLGASIGAIPHVAPELVERAPSWRAMVQNVKSVATQAFQVWLRADARELGWNRPAPVNLSGFVEPFDTWADMTHLERVESFEEPVRSIAYFCSVLPDVAPEGPDLPGIARAYVRDNIVRFLDWDVGWLWPAAVRRPGEFRWDLLVDPEEARSGAPRSTGAARFDSQFWTANVNPSDRYVLSMPGSIKYRISPLDMTFDNLTIAGDWTRTGLDTGCVESAVMSGLLAAHAISHHPPLDEIIGYDHP